MDKPPEAGAAPEAGGVRPAQGELALVKSRDFH